MSARILCVREQVEPAGLRRDWTGVLGHSHMLRNGGLPFEEAKAQLVAWTRRMDIAAVGVGSPWEPVSAAHYGQYEGPDRDRYFGGRVDPASVMDRDAVSGLIDDLNARAAGYTHFYLDNETPKGRYGHMWFYGYHYDVPAWHDYSQDRPIQYYRADPECEVNALTGQPHRRRCTLDILGVQRRAGALGVWAHPTSWWRSNGRFVTNIASEIVLHLLIDGRLDAMAVQGYDACHRSYQALWFHLLDTGAIVPGVAEVDGCFDSPKLADQAIAFRTLIPRERPLDTRAIVSAVRRGRMAASSGPCVDLLLDGVPMGGVCSTSPAHVHRGVVRAYPAPGESRLSRVELIGRGGTVLARVEAFAGGVIEFEVDGGAEPSYLVARVFGEHDQPDVPRQQSIRHCALGNPVYMHPRGFRRTPAKTDCILRFGSASPWIGGTFAVCGAAGETFESGPVRAGMVRGCWPAGAFVRLERDGTAPWQFHLAMENGKVQALLRYLHNGEFLKDFPGCAPGEVPTEAFRYAAMREALATLETDL